MKGGGQEVTVMVGYLKFNNDNSGEIDAGGNIFT